MPDEINPYASPQSPIAAVSAALYPDSRPIIPYASARTLGACTIFALALQIVQNLAIMGTDWVKVDVLDRLRRGMPINPVEAHRVQQIWSLSRVADGFIVLATGVVFLMWFYRVHRNLPALGIARPRFSPGWAVGSFFVPILCLFRPCEIMAEVCRGSNPESFRPGPRYLVGRLPPLLGFWWGFFLLKNMAAPYLAMGLSSLSRGATPDARQYVCWVEIVAMGISIAAAVFCIQLIRWVNAGQERCHELAEQTPGGEEDFSRSGTSAQNPFATELRW